MAVEQLIGAWDLVSWFDIRSGVDENERPSGDIGKLIYTADGHVSAQIVRKHPARFQHEDWRRASDAEIASAWAAYFGYFGTYSVDTENQLITHHIEGAFFPNLTGTDQVRRYCFEGSQLILDADTAWGCIRVIWERATPVP